VIPQLVGIEQVVGVEERQVVAGGTGDADIAGVADAAVIVVR
jgi:hypothetical protein